jgi:hypothetical protein
VGTVALTQVQTKAARLVGAGYAQEDVAKHCDTSTRTIQRWQKLDGFMDAAAKAREEAGDPDATSVLRELMLNGKSEQTRLQAARTLLLAPPKDVDPDYSATPRITVFGGDLDGE